MIGETRRAWCERQLNNKRLLSKLDQSMPEIAKGAGVGYRWLIHIKNGTRKINVDSDRVDYLYSYLNEQIGVEA